MSYCRFSSDDYQCDVYVYAHIAGYWTTHVASNRYAFQEPLPSQVSWVPGACNDDWFKRHEKVSQMVRKAKLVNIGLAHDGQTFDDPTPEACADRLEQLRAAGYVVPQSAIDRLREEAAHGDRAGESTSREPGCEKGERGA